MNQLFETFNQYPWNSDEKFQSGYKTIMDTIGAENDDLRLLKAKHFYFTKFQQSFDFADYLEYERQKKQEELFEAVKAHKYEEDEAFMTGLPYVIRGWLEQQKEGLWDKEKLELELEKSKSIYYNTKIQNFDLIAYFKWNAKKKQDEKPACPFANLWQNKGKAQNVDQVNAASFAVTKKQNYNGPIEITLSSPTTKNIFSIDRIHELQEAYQKSKEADVTFCFLKATVHHTTLNQTDERIQTNDTKVMSCGLAYEETSLQVSGSELREASLYKLASVYYNFVQQELLQPKKPIVSFSNGHVPLNAVYLLLPPKSLRLITEHVLVDFKLEISHTPIPPLCLLRSCHVSKGLDLYLALAAPAYSKLRGPELLHIGLADVFVPEIKLNEAFELAKLMAVCPQPRSVQLALSTRHTYAGPNRLSVWQNQIQDIFGNADSFDDLKSRLSRLDNAWSKNIIHHWSTLPPSLLKVVFRAVCQSRAMSLEETLVLELDLNTKWRQTKDYKEWLRSKNDWETDGEAFYFEKLQLSSMTEAVVYKVPDQSNIPLVCPITGQTALSCPVSGQSVD